MKNSFLRAPLLARLPGSLLGLGLRLLFGWQFLQTGLGKLRHLQATSEYFGGLGLPAPGLFAPFMGGLECVGGVLLCLGLLSRPISALLTAAMVGALLTAHRADLLQGPDALLATAPFPYLMAVLVILVHGPGDWSLDRLLKHVPGAGTTLARA
jgi:putative oxidoreductase